MINEAQINTQVLTLLDQMSQITENPAQARQQFADGLTAIIVGAIRSATVTLATGTVNVTCASGPGTNLAPVIGTLT